MGIFDTIKDLWTEYRSPTQIAPPTAAPTGTIGTTQIVQTPPSLRKPEQVHATTPTVHIHEKEPDKKKVVKVLRDPRTLAETRKALTTIDTKLGERIPTIHDIQQKGAEFRQQHPRTADVLYTALEKGATAVKSPTAALERVGAERAANVYESIGKGVGEHAIGRYQKFEQTPMKWGVESIAVPVVTGAGAGAGFKAGTYGTRLAIKSAAAKATAAGMPRAAQVIGAGGRVIEPTVAVVTTGQIVHEVMKAETPKERVDILADIAIGFAGASVGWRGTGKAIESYRVRGRTEVPIESIVEPDVVSGVESFPMTRRAETPTQLISRFKESEFKLPTDKDGVTVWHAAPETLGSKVGVLGKVARGSDVPGLYTAPSLSPHFLRLTKAPKATLYSRFFGSPEPLEPTALRIGVKDVVRLPESVRYDVSKASEYLQTQAPKGEATLTPVLETTLRGKGRAEAEAVITPETLLGRVEKRYYVKIEGHKVPIDTYKTVGKSSKVDVVGKIERDVVTASKLSKTESYKQYQEGLFKPYYRGGVSSRSKIVDTTSRVSAVKITVSPPTSSRIGVRDRSYIGSIYDSTPRVPSEPIRPVDTIDSSTVPPREPRRPVPEIPRYTPPETPRYTQPPEPPMITLKKKDKKAKKKTRRQKLKRYQYFIENPIASPFGESVGRMR